jgi:hypothetical protein
MAADIALHFWYSVFMPMEYRLQISVAMTSVLERAAETQAFVSDLGPRSTLSVIIPEGWKECLMHFISSSFSLDKAQDEYDRVRLAPSRQEFRERMYANLRPSHRVAFLDYRRFGIVYPFGAQNAHFNVPNTSLFSIGGQWLQSDYADPLEGWE